MRIFFVQILQIHCINIIHFKLISCFFNIILNYEFNISKRSFHFRNVINLGYKNIIMIVLVFNIFNNFVYSVYFYNILSRRNAKKNKLCLLYDLHITKQ